MTSITIHFPSEAHAQTFAEWMSDGGGEWGYLEALDQQGHPKVIVGYHGEEKRQFSREDRRRYGAFMEDATIRVELAPQDS